MEVQYFTLFIQFTGIGFTMGLGAWLVAFGLASAWRMFKASIGL